MMALSTFVIIPCIYQEGMRSNFPEYCKKPPVVIFCLYLQDLFCSFFRPFPRGLSQSQAVNVSADAVLEQLKILQVGGVIITACALSNVIYFYPIPNDDFVKGVVI